MKFLFSNFKEIYKKRKRKKILLFIIMKAWKLSKPM